MRKYFGYFDGIMFWKEVVGFSLYVYKVGILKIYLMNDFVGDWNNI